PDRPDGLGAGPRRLAVDLELDHTLRRVESSGRLSTSTQFLHPSQPGYGTWSRKKKASPARRNDENLLRTEYACGPHRLAVRGAGLALCPRAVHVRRCRNARAAVSQGTPHGARASLAGWRGDPLRIRSHREICAREGSVANFR